MITYLRHCGLWDPSAVWPWGEGRGSTGLFPVAHIQCWDVMYVQGKWETVEYGFFATWTYTVYVPFIKCLSVGACISLQLRVGIQYMWELYYSVVCVCVFLFHLSLLLSVLRPSVPRFVKPVCLFSSKVVGFRDKNKHCFRTNRRTCTTIPLYRMCFFSLYKGDYIPLSKLVKTLC